MQATKDHISLETAKLLRDCGVMSKYSYQKLDSVSESDRISYSTDLCQTLAEWSLLEGVIMRTEDDLIEKFRIKWRHTRFVVKYPAYTWQEILWEYADEFFGASEKYKENKIWHIIIKLLQQKKYTEADLYFREHCILIKQ